jgi:hypothetical protein
MRASAEATMVLVRHNPGKGRPRVVRGHGGGERLGAWAAALVRALVLLAWAGAASNPAHAQAPAEGRPQTCRIGVNVEDLYDIDTAADTFGALLWVWTLCPTAELDPLADVAFPTASAISLGELESVDTGGAGHYRYRRVQGTFRQDWDVARYPFDRHRAVIPIDETRQGASVVVFEADTAGSFLSPDILQKRHEWRVADFAVAASVSEEAQTYGLPNIEAARYARAEASFTLTRTGLLTFLKLTTGVFAAAFIALMSFFYDPRDPQGFGRRLGLLVGALFGVLINMRTADTVIGDTGRLTLVTEIHLVALALIVALAALALRDWWRFEGALPLAYPNWTELAATGGLFALATAGLIARAAWGG